MGSITETQASLILKCHSCKDDIDATKVEMLLEKYKDGKKFFLTCPHCKTDFEISRGMAMIVMNFCTKITTKY